MMGKVQLKLKWNTSELEFAVERLARAAAELHEAILLFQEAAAELDLAEEIEVSASIPAAHND